MKEQLKPGTIWENVEWWDELVEVEDVVEGVVEYSSIYDDSISYYMDVSEFLKIHKLSARGN